jgi:selenocysteine-specific elongation factor
MALARGIEAVVMIIATAGHVDHGKTSLVRAITGVDTDRLPEEKARGLTIDLGFAYMSLPDGRIVGFVDVPGHQRFIKNMLAGVANVDHALVVVAADDGVMPQTVEHVQILNLLGVRHASIAITKCDKAAASRCDEVAAQSRALVGENRIDRVIRTSIRDGEGIDDLRTHIEDVAARHAAAPAAGRFRMAVDRAFIVHGVGVVVTGSVHAGAAVLGDEMTIAPAGLSVRLRGLRIHDRTVDSVRTGDRCAAQLASIALEDVKRGDWIVAGPNRTTARLDVELTLFGRNRSSRQRPDLHLHIGAGVRPCRVVPIAAKDSSAGASTFAALHLELPIIAWAGQKFVLRDPAAQQTIGGGRVLDPQPPTRSNRTVRVNRLGALSAPDADAAFVCMLAISSRGLDVDEFVEAWNLTEPEAQALLGLHDIAICRNAGRRLAVRADHWAALQDEIVAALGSHHEAQPHRLGLNDDALAAAIRPAVAKPALRQAVAALAAAGVVTRRGRRCRPPRHHRAPHEPRGAADGWRDCAVAAHRASARERRASAATRARARRNRGSRIGAA